MAEARFSILISTKNRCSDLLRTLHTLTKFLVQPNIECVVFDDGSTDGTSEMVRKDFPRVILRRNNSSKGYIFCRNQMLNETTSDYAISLDDDANFLSDDPLEIISSWFAAHPECGLIAFRIFWGMDLPAEISDFSEPHRVRGFVGCGHVWRMSAWRSIPQYPEWFGFYGEEEFAARELFLQRIEVHYVPAVLVHHRVDMKNRQQDNSYDIRMRRSLASGWYLFHLFLPIHHIPRKMVSSIAAKIRVAINERSFLPIKLLIQALFDLVSKTPHLIAERHAFSRSQYNRFHQIPATVIYWKPNNGGI